MGDVIDGDGWRQVRIADVTEDVANENPSRNPDKNFAYVDISSIDNKRLRITSPRIIKGRDAPSRARRRIQEGDILFSNVRTYLRNIARVDGIEQPALASTGFSVLRPKADVDSDYLFRYVSSRKFIERVTPMQTGSHYPATSEAVVRAQSILIPGLDEQHRIAAFLKKLESSVDSCNSRLAQAASTLADFRRSLLAAACSGQLSADVRANEQQSDGSWIEAYLRHGRLPVDADAAGKADGLTADSQIESLPPSWRLIRLGDVFDVATGGTPLRKNSSYYEGGSIPWVTSSAVNAGMITEASELITELAIAETNAKVFSKGTLLVAMYGEGQTRGRVGELAIEAATNQAVAAVLFDERNSALRDYLRIFFEDSYQRIRALAFGGVQMNLSLGVIKDTLVPLPPPNERDEIVRRVHQGLAAYEEAGRRLAVTSQRVERATDLAVAAAFSGDSSSSLVGEGEATVGR